MSNQIDIQEPFKRITAEEAKRLIDQGVVHLIDVREQAELAQGRIANSTLVPLNALLSRPTQYLKEDNIIFYCAEGIRSAVACEMAAAVGFENLYNLEGGINSWAAKGLPVER
jgi:rhodanese-related sulfurtransferase